MRIEATTQIDIKYSTTVEDLKKVIDSIPSTAKIRVDKYVGDQRDPSYTHLIFTWSEER